MHPQELAHTGAPMDRDLTAQLQRTTNLATARLYPSQSVGHQGCKAALLWEGSHVWWQHSAQLVHSDPLLFTNSTVVFPHITSICIEAWQGWRTPSVRIISTTFVYVAPYIDYLCGMVLVTKTEEKNLKMSFKSSIYQGIRTHACNPKCANECKWNTDCFTVWHFITLYHLTQQDWTFIIHFTFFRNELETSSHMPEPSLFRWVSQRCISTNYWIILESVRRQMPKVTRIGIEIRHFLSIPFSFKSYRWRANSCNASKVNSKNHQFISAGKAHPFRCTS